MSVGEATEWDLDPVSLPEASEWIDAGLVLDAGGFGAWDALMEGHTPAAVIRRDGTYLLYYVGADDYFADLRNIGPAHRSLGVATSEDGINWSKHTSEPVITFTSSGNPEEGAVSAGMTVDVDGPLLAYSGANIASDPNTSNIPTRVSLAM